MFNRLLKTAFFCLSLVSTSAFASGVIVIRHAQGEHNVQRFFSSNPKNKTYRVAHLTDKGKEQAAAAGEKLRAGGLKPEAVSVIYASPLPRTQETAQIIAGKLGVSASKIKATPEVIEVDFGKYDGTPLDAFPWPNLDLSHAHEYGGETYQDVKKRVSAFMQKTLQKNCKRDDTVMIVSHGDTITAIREHLTGKHEAMLGNAEAVEFSWEQVCAKPAS